MGGFHVVGFECQMEFLVTEIVWFCTVFEPGQFQFEIGCVVAHIDNDKGAIGGFLTTQLVETECSFLKGHGTLQVKDIVVFVVHLEFHGKILLKLFLYGYTFTVMVQMME